MVIFDLTLALVFALLLLLKASARLDAADQEQRALDLKLRSEQEYSKRLRAELQRYRGQRDDKGRYKSAKTKSEQLNFGGLES